jgi:osmoprotectant transport system permease protein
MNTAVAAALAALPDKLAAHVALSVAALALALAIAAPLVLLARSRPWLRRSALAAAGLVQTIPALALLALFYPALLAVRGVTGGTLPVLGFLPALLALALYALLPLLRGGLGGLDGVDRDVLEAADGIGLTRRQRLLLVELPLAAPVIVGGVRTAAVWTIGAATLATAVGATCLGDFIFAGLQTENWVAVLIGCGAAAALAVATDACLGLVEAGLGRGSRKRIVAGAAGLALIAAAALVPAGTVPAMGNAPSKPVIVGAKNFSEQYILAAVIADRIAPRTTVQRTGLGSAVAFRALAADDIDVYVDYTGTLWTGVLGHTTQLPRTALVAALTRELGAKFGVGVAGPLGFENAYVLAVPRALATRLHLATIADLARAAPALALGTDIEFLSRPEWASLDAAYHFRFKAKKSFEPTFMYRALASGDVDVISAFSSDGRIAAQDLVVLADPAHAIPSYDALLLISPARARDHSLDAALRPLIGSIHVEAMRRANLLVDRDTGKRSPAEAARTLLP